MLNWQGTCLLAPLFKKTGKASQADCFGRFAAPRCSAANNRRMSTKGDDVQRSGQKATTNPGGNRERKDYAAEYFLIN